jgi:hypothetical protein
MRCIIVCVICACVGFINEGSSQGLYLMLLQKESSSIDFRERMYSCGKDVSKTALKYKFSDSILILKQATALSASILNRNKSCLFVYLFYLFIFPVALWPNAGHDILLHEVSRPHTTTHHTRNGFFGRVIKPSQRPLPDNTQNLQQTNIYVPSGIRKPNPNKRSAADPRLIPRVHWDRYITWEVM